MRFYWPLCLLLISNICYHMSAKQISPKIDPFASLVVTYLVGAVLAAVMFFVMNPGDNLLEEYHYLNWTPFLLGASIVGLEVGYIYMYKVGWNLNTGYLVQSIAFSIALIIIGALFFKESLTPSKLVGIALCLAGVIVINK